MVGKKGYLRTIEAVIAVMMTFVLLTFFLPQSDPSDSPENFHILATLGKSADFRSCVVLMNTSCINQSIDERLEDSYAYLFNISEDVNVDVAGLPSKRVYSDSVLVAGNTTDRETKVVRLFYWTK
ncbi:MAG: hypothetical protein GY861_28480 [bacterium]|nr:hypothetical protein [bacterium]